MKNKEFPLVSICIPTFNGEAYIAEALFAAIHQDYPNLEIIVSDDASKDRTLDIVESFKSKTKIPIYIFHHKPNGIGANWNYSVKQSNGVYVKFLFQDDVLETNCISKMMTLMTDPKVGLVYSKRNFIYKNLTPDIQAFIEFYGPLHRSWQDFKVLEGVLSGKQYLKDKQFLNSPKNKIGEPTNVLLRKECFDTIGYFSETLLQTLDSDYWYRVMTKYDIGFINKNLASFRLHNKQASIINKQQGVGDNALINKQYYNTLYKYLHPKNKLKLLKLYHPFFSTLVKIKRFFYDF